MPECRWTFCFVRLATEYYKIWRVCKWSTEAVKTKYEVNPSGIELAVQIIVCFSGLRNVCDDVQFMLGKKPNVYWRITWSFFAPVILSVNILIHYEPVYRLCSKRRIYILLRWDARSCLHLFSGNIHHVSGKVQASGWRFIRLPRLGWCCRFLSRMPFHSADTNLRYFQHFPTERFITEKCEHLHRRVRRQNATKPPNVAKSKSLRTKKFLSVSKPSVKYLHTSTLKCF